MTCVLGLVFTFFAELLKNVQKRANESKVASHPAKMEDEGSEEAILRCLVDRHRLEAIRNPRRRGRAWDCVTKDLEKPSGKSMQLRMTVSEMTELKPCNVLQKRKRQSRPWPCVGTASKSAAAKANGAASTTEAPKSH